MTLERIDAEAVLEGGLCQPHKPSTKMAVEMRVGETLVLVPPGGEAITIELKHKSGACARVEVRAGRSVRIKPPT